MSKLVYAPLHSHSDASISDGLFGPKLWSKAFKELGFQASALTDHGSMANIIPLYKLMKEQGLTLIVGCEFYYVDDPTNKTPDNRKNSHIILLAKNYDGFQNMLKLSELSYTEGYYYKNRIGLEWLKKYSENLVCLTACQGGVLANQVWRERKGQECIGLEKKFHEIKNIFGKDLYVEFQGHRTPNYDDSTKELFCSQEMINKAFYERLRKESGFQPVLTNDSHYILPEHANIQRVMKEMAYGKSDVGESATVTKDHFTDSLWLKNHKQVYEAFRRNHEYLPKQFVVDSMLNTVEVFEKCKDFEFPKGKRYLPSYTPTKKEVERFGETDPKKFFKLIAISQFNKMWKEGVLCHASKTEYMARFKKEYDVISKYGLEDYFLIVWDLIRYAQENNIYTGLGRGSAAGCLISYLLGIVKIDPLEHKLIFERFLNENRCESGELPDIDSDFESIHRGQIKRYIFEKYGKDKVCEIGTYGRMKLKTSLLDFGKAFGVGTHKDLLKITKNLDLDKESVDDLEEAIKQDPELERLMNENPDYEFAVKECIGQIKSQGVHPAGLIICSEPVAHVTPVKSQVKKKTDEFDDPEEGEKRIVATQTEDKHVIAQGLMKVDILGVKQYDIIKYVIENADTGFTRDNYVTEIMRLERESPNKKVWKMFQNGDTDGVFQFSCLSGDTIICIKEKKTIRDVFLSKTKKKGSTQLTCLLLDEGRWRRSGIKAIKSTGVKPTYRMVTKDRRFIRSTLDHKFITPDGWKELRDIKVGEKVGFKINWGDLRLDGLRLCVECGKEKLSGAERCHTCSAKFYKNPHYNKDKLRRPKSVSNNWAKGGISKDKLAVMMKKRAVTWEKTLADGWVNPLKGKKNPKMSGRNNPMFGKRTKSKMGFREDLGHFVRSTWEADYARILRYHNIDYQYEPETFDLGDMTYTPDFYIPSEDKYVEIKGWMTEKSMEKINAFIDKFPNKKLEVINRTEFAELALKYKKLINWECPRFPEGFVWEEVSSIDFFGEEETFDLCMANSAHNYIANGFVTHNSSGMKELLIQMKPDCINDLVAANALYRPGCLENGWHTLYCNRKNGLEGVDYIHEDVEGALSDTYGVIVFQEQFMEVIHRLGGISLVESDIIRSALGKKDKEKLAKFKSKFVEGASKKISEEEAEELWEQIEKASGYSFNRSHSAAYAVLAYISQYLKVYHTSHFWCANLQWAVVKKKENELSTMRQASLDMKVKHRLPEINTSKADFYVAEDGTIVWGFLSVNGVGPQAAKDLERLQPYLSWDDFADKIKKSKIKKNNIEGLIYAGAFDSFGDRKDLLFRIHDTKTKKAKTEKPFISPSEVDLILKFRDSMGFFEQQIKRARPGFSKYCIDQKELEEYDSGEAVRVGGIITNVSIIRTKSGDSMCFITLEDMDELLEITCFPKIYSEFKTILKKGNIIEVQGTKSGYNDKRNCVEASEIELK